MSKGGIFLDQLAGCAKCSNCFGFIGSRIDRDCQHLLQPVSITWHDLISARTALCVAIENLSLTDQHHCKYGNAKSGDFLDTCSSLLPFCRSLLTLCDREFLMPKTRSQELWEKAAEERQRCRDWLLLFMRSNQPKFLTKAELRDAAIRELRVSKNSFDFGWIEAIEQTGRHDWYEPLRRRSRTKN
jgi:hypothetical protein